METIEKIDIKKMKEDIKEMVSKQKTYKNQRRTVRLVGERTMTHWEAERNHSENRFNLRIMYAVYGLARGKSLSQIEFQHSEESHPLLAFQRNIEKITKKYTILVPVEVE